MSRSEFVSTFIAENMRWRCIKFKKHGKRHYGYFPQHSHMPIWSDKKLSRVQFLAVLSERRLAKKSVTPVKRTLLPDDLILWPCGTQCYRHELPEFTHKSDDYEEVAFGSARYELLCKELSDE